MRLPPPVAGPDGAVDPDALAERARAVLRAHWRPEGYAVPNAEVYPYQWLWDSCFHAVCWSELGEPDRAVAELTAALAHQGDDGFVPHMTYWSAPDRHASFWGRRWTSSITQPPLYGHAVAELVRRGVDVPADLTARATAGLRFLLDRADDAGRPVVVHPWETGCDDSPRWDAFAVPGRTWREVKGELVAAVRTSPSGSPVGSDRFVVASAGFGALVAFNAAELASVTGDTALAAAADRLATELAARFDPGRRSWPDVPAPGQPATSAAVRTLDALLPALVLPEPGAAVLRDLVDPEAHGAAFGPTGVHRAEPCFAPAAYWRGSNWPQLDYLLWVAARRAGSDALAATLVERTVAGAVASGFAEHWQPDTGAGLGAAPQSWTALVAVMARGGVDQAGTGRA